MKQLRRLQCPNSLFQVWELFLQQVEVNSQQHGDISRNFNQNCGSGLIERVFHRKIQSKKLFAHRDRIETILLKSNELLLKVSLFASYHAYLSRKWAWHPRDCPKTDRLALDAPLKWKRIALN